MQARNVCSNTIMTVIPSRVVCCGAAIEQRKGHSQAYCWEIWDAISALCFSGNSDRAISDDWLLESKLMLLGGGGGGGWDLFFSFLPNLSTQFSMI